MEPVGWGIVGESVSLVPAHFPPLLGGRQFTRSPHTCTATAKSPCPTELSYHVGLCYEFCATSQNQSFLSQVVFVRCLIKAASARVINIGLPISKVQFLTCDTRRDAIHPTGIYHTSMPQNLGTVCKGRDFTMRLSCVLACC